MRGFGPSLMEKRNGCCQTNSRRFRPKFRIRLTVTCATLANNIDISADTSANTRLGAVVRLRFDNIKWNTNALVTLEWDADTDVLFQTLTVGQEEWDYKPEGGINNNAGTGITGDVIITPTNPTDYDMTLWFTKKFT